MSPSTRRLHAPAGMLLAMILTGDPGIYRYRCTRYSSDFHRGMVGAVVVQ